MRNLNELNRYRRTDVWVVKRFGEIGDDKAGFFELPNGGQTLRVVASSGEGWDHVSVSTQNRTPTWAEMEGVKHIFFHDHETVMQLHVPADDHINYHPHCLHLWRPLKGDIPRPPDWMIGPKKERG